MSTSATDPEGTASSLRGYLDEALRMVRAWMNLYFSTLGLLGLVLLVAVFQLERDCRALSDGYLLQIPIVVPERCYDAAGGKPSITLFGVELIRDFASIVFGFAYAVFVGVLLLRVRVFAGILGPLAALPESEAQRAAMSVDLQYFPWPASPFRQGCLGAVLFWGGLGLGLFVVGLMGLTHLLPKTGELVIATSLYRAVGAINLALVAVSLVVLFGIWRQVAAIRAASRRGRSPRRPA